MNTDGINAALVSASGELCVVDSGIDAVIAKIQQTSADDCIETELNRLMERKKELEGQITILEHWLKNPAAKKPYD